MGRALKKPDKPHCYEFRMVSVTVDCVIFGWDTDGLHVLLIERGESPYEGRWALPGGAAGGVTGTNGVAGSRPAPSRDPRFGS